MKEYKPIKLVPNPSPSFEEWIKTTSEELNIPYDPSKLQEYKEANDNLLDMLGLFKE